MSILYARKEPATDKLAPKRLDVVFYKDKEAKELYCRWMWYLSPPTKRNRYVNLNCFRWRIAWFD